LEKRICLLGSLFSSFSFLVTVGLLAALMSNMMAWAAVLFFWDCWANRCVCVQRCLVLLRHLPWCFFFARLYVKFYDDHFRLFSVYLLFAPRFGLSSMLKLKLALVITVSNVIVEFVRSFVQKSGSVAVARTR
jgi:hypothetical protein